MLVETIELTLSHVDLGWLDEFALLTLFGTAHSHRITAGTGRSLREIRDGSGEQLYPGYYWTHLSVPLDRPLRRYQVWDRLQVGVDVQRFGAMLLASTYALGDPGELDEHDASRWDLERLPSMRAANTFYKDADQQAASAAAGCIAELPSLPAAPLALARFREVRASGRIAPELAPTLRHADPIEYRLIAGRDVMPGRGVMFSRFIAIADSVEREMLTRRAWPAMPTALVEHLGVIERETFYFANLRDEHALRCTYAASVKRCAPDHHGGDRALISTAILDAVVELYDEANVLLVACRVRKLLAVPRDQPERFHLAERWLATHAR